MDIASSAVRILQEALLVDGNQLTGWAEGDEGDGIGVDVVVPQILDLTKPIRIWAGYGKSPELFVANGRPKRVQLDVLRLRAAEPAAHDATSCSASTYVEPVVVAGHQVDLRDFNGSSNEYTSGGLEWCLISQSAF